MSVEVGNVVRLKQKSYWTAPYARLAKSGREGVVESVFTPAGSSRVRLRVVYHKRGRAKERIEFLGPDDVEVIRVSASDPEGEDGLPAECEASQNGGVAATPE